MCPSQTAIGPACALCMSGINDSIPNNNTPVLVNELLEGQTTATTLPDVITPSCHSTVTHGSIN